MLFIERSMWTMIHGDCSGWDCGDGAGRRVVHVGCAHGNGSGCRDASSVSRLGPADFIAAVLWLVVLLAPTSSSLSIAPRRRQTRPISASIPGS